MLQNVLLHVLTTIDRKQGHGLHIAVDKEEDKEEGRKKIKKLFTSKIFDKTLRPLFCECP